MKDNKIYKNKWVFDKDVSVCFDDMIKRSIPDYDTMRSLILLLAEDYLTSLTSFNLLDVGCSNRYKFKNVYE